MLRSAGPCIVPKCRCIAVREPVLSWIASPDGARVVVRTTRGTYEARHLVLAPGPWAPRVFDLPRIPLTVERQVLFWFAPVGGLSLFAPDRFPIYIWDVGGGFSPARRHVVCMVVMNAEHRRELAGAPVRAAIGRRLTGLREDPGTIATLAGVRRRQKGHSQPFPACRH